MKERSSHRIIWFELGALLTLLALVTLWVPTPLSTAQQGNRQLNREQAQQANRASQRRIALVIGNGLYQSSKLKNPPNDATAVAGVLRDLGFEVTSGVNKSQREMKQMIREFGQRLRANGGVGLFYFAGHGVQAKGRNYLIPVDADIQAEPDLEDQAVDVNYLLSFIDDAHNALNIVILDACRNNPFARSFRSSQEGLAQVKAPTGTLIAYATAPDSVAGDGGSANSPYTEELMKQMRVPGVLVETMFRRLAEQVSSRTSGRQEPWFSANVKGDFFFSEGPNNATIDAKSPAILSADAAAIELSYWDSIKNSTSVEDFRAYLQRYPNGEFGDLAKNRINSLEAAVKEKETANYHLNLAKTLGEQKKYAEAEAEAREALRLAPNNEYGHELLGQSLLRQERYAEAEKSLREAVRLAPNTQSYRYNLGLALASEGKHAEAEVEFNEAVRLDPAEAADVPKFFKGTYGIGAILVSTFVPVVLRVWRADDIFFYDEPYNGRGYAATCAQFVDAHVKGSSIHDIRDKSDNTKWRFNTESASSAAGALEAVRAVCKGK